MVPGKPLGDSAQPSQVKKSPTPEQQKAIDELEALQRLMITNLAFSGGGAKGIVYPGAYRAMSEAGFLDNITQIAGASAGAITAAFIAVGMPIEELRNKSLNTNFAHLLGNLHFTEGKEGALRIISRDGKPLLEMISSSVNQTLIAFFRHQPDDAFAQFEVSLTTDLQTLKTKMLGTHPTFTFRDLFLLQRAYPLRFKNLSVMVAKYPSGEPVICNHANTPDLEIALACRASGSIPLALDPVRLTINGQSALYIDGGIPNNLPSDIFSGPTANVQTLAFAFGTGDVSGVGYDTDRAENAMHGSHWSDLFSHNCLQSIFNDALNLVKADPHLNKHNDQAFKNVLCKAVLQVLTQYFEKNPLQLKQEDVIITRLQTVIFKAIQAVIKSKSLAHATITELPTELADLLARTTKQMAPDVYTPDLKELFGQNFAPRLLMKFRPSYLSTDRKREDYLKVHNNPLRTVNLHTGPINTISFVKATKLARTMDAIGYADMMTFILNHAAPAQKNTEKLQHYCRDVVDDFVAIYQGVLLGSGKTGKGNILLETILHRRKAKTDPNEIELGLFQVIKDHVIKHPNSAAAFAFTRAIEYKSGVLSKASLRDETYVESFKRSGLFSRSKVTGITFYRSKPLEERLKKMSSAQKTNLFKTSPVATRRASQVDEALNKISAHGKMGEYLKDTHTTPPIITP